MAALPGYSSVKFKMEKETFEEIEEIASAYEESIACYKTNILMDQLKMSLVVHQTESDREKTY